MVLKPVSYINNTAAKQRGQLLAMTIWSQHSIGLF